MNAISPDKYRSIPGFFDTITILFAGLMLYNETCKDSKLKMQKIFYRYEIVLLGEIEK